MSPESAAPPPLLLSAGQLQRLAATGAAPRPGLPLAEVTTFRLGGPCPLLLDCSTPATVADVVRLLLADALPYRLIGGGSNLLVSDRGLPEIVVRFVSDAVDVQRDGDRITVNAGTSLDRLALYTCEQGLAGFVNTSGIPGTVGGAVVGNAGAWGWQVADALESLSLLTPAGDVVDADPAALGFAYRHSDLKTNGHIVLTATFRLAAAEPATLLAERAEILAKRAEKHPHLATEPCAGSFFRNVEPSSKADRRQAAGFFLEEAGAKAMRQGGAVVFRKHANIIIKADASCTAQDVLTLSARMAAAVKAMHGLDLRREVLVTGDFDWPADAHRD